MLFSIFACTKMSTVHQQLQYAVTVDHEQSLKGCCHPYADLFRSSGATVPLPIQDSSLTLLETA